MQDTSFTTYNSYDVKAQITDIFLKMSNAMHRGDGDFTEEQHLAIASAIVSFNEADKIIQGEESESVFYETYQRVYKKQMKQNHDAEDWSGEVDWRNIPLPKNVLIRVATIVALSDSDKTMSWYKYCQENVEV